MKYFNVGYKSTNYYLIEADRYCLAIDCGCPATINDYGRQLRSTERKVQTIDYLIVTHFHVDHAGLVQEIKEQGVRFVLVDIQVNHIVPMETMIQKKMKYKPINLKDNFFITVPESRKNLQSIGISGEVIHTPGHTEDSISIVLDSADVFIGDLRPENQIMKTDSISKNSWTTLRTLGVQRVHPGHGLSFEL
jgi:glyoxylase-like metal-dependent hydrolase (beta-lactamase superfamily II)